MIQEQPSKTWIVVIVAIISATGLICAAIIGLGTPFAERWADEYYPLSTPTIERESTSDTSETQSNTSSPSITVQLPSDISCQQHSSGYCGVSMTISWSNIDTDSNYYIYTIGHGLNYQPEMWWVAGNGIPINTSMGNWVINDSAYGNSGDSLGVFTCLTKTKYDFNGKKEILFYEKPDCDLYSTEVYFQPK